MEPILEKMSANVTELEHAGMRFFASRTGARDMVAISGSIFGGWNHMPLEKGEVPGLAAEIMDAGTARKTKDQIRESLAEHGASLSFSPGGDRLHFSGTCLPDDISFLLKMIVECISGAAFPAAEVKTAKERTLAEIEEEKNETRSLASTALSRMLYDSTHVNYPDTLAVRKKKVEKVTRAELLAFRKMLGQQGLVLALTGDVQPESVLKEAKKIFSTLPKGKLTEPQKALNKKKAESREELITIPDKATIDLFLGASIPLTIEDPLYYPFVILFQMLGGPGFTSHLMKTIRERDGLTYHVRALLRGHDNKADGDFRVYVSFSPQRYTESVAKLREEIRIFFKEGLNKKDLEARKTEMIGSYKVHLSTARSLANRLHQIGEEGKDIGYLDEYPDLVNAVTLKDLHAAAALIPLDKLSLAAAGTFVK
jgi:zinc protease